MPTKLGGQTGGLFASARQFFLTVQPACWKVYSNALGAAKDYKQWSPRTFIVGREVRGQQFAAEDPDPIGTANRYADLVISTAAQTPGIDAWEFYNEPVINISVNGQFDLAASIDAAQKLNIAQMTFSSRLHAAGLKVVAYNLARGNPDNRLVPYLAGGAGASDYIGLHAYFAPRFQDDAVNQALRYRQIMALLPAWARKPVIFTEYGTDFNGGGFRLEANHMTPDEFVASCKAWDAALMEDKYVAGSCGFVFGADSGRWETFEMSSDDVLPQLSEAMKNSVPVSAASVGEPIPPPIDPPPTGGNMTTAEKRSADGFNAAQVAYNKDAALFKYAQAHGLGYPVTNEYNATYDGATWINQGYAAAIVGCVVGDYQNVKAFDWLTGAPYVPPTTPPIPPPTTVNRLTTADVSQYGFRVESYQPKAGEKFFGLVSIGNIQSGPQVGTTSTMVANNEAGGNAIGYKLAHAYDAANLKFEKFDSPTVGVVLGPGSYIGANGPQDRFYVCANDGQLGVKWPTPLGDVLVAGMPNGEHWQATYIWQLMTG